MIDDILGGKHDHELDALGNAIYERRKTLAKRLASSLKPGDQVMFNDKASPKYLVGATAVVTAKRAKAVSSVMIKLDEHVGRYPQGYELTCPTIILDQI